MKIESALNAPYDTGKLMLTNDTYSIINLYKTTFPHNVILGWYYMSEEPDQHIKSMFETIKENSTSKMVLHLDRVSLSHRELSIMIIGDCIHLRKPWSGNK
jgi:hypothetical protein